MAPWVVLSTEWKLEDVQAGLNVIITITCATFIFTWSQFFWHRTARRISKDENAPLTSLLTFTTVGEVIDVVSLFKLQLIQQKYARLTVQCLVVLIFSLSAVFAGPISRYSTKVGIMAAPRPVQGRLASRSLSCDVNNNVKWHEVFTRLQDSNFPFDQLLDFYPDNGTNWVYDADEWNPAYSTTCNFTKQTAIQLNATGNHVDDDRLYLYFEIPELWNVLSPRFRKDDIVHFLYWGGTRNPESGIWDDVILWQYADLSLANVTNESNATTQHQGISLASIYMKGIPEYNLSAAGENDKDWVFGVGEVPQAFYTKVECDINRNRPPDDNNYWEAYPQIRSNCDVAQQLDIQWSATALQPSGNEYEMNVSIPTGEDLFRFYQSWMISKDTYFPYPTSREISLIMTTVEISIIFIVIWGLIMVNVLLGLIHYGFFKLRHRNSFDGIPETKVDWISQTVQQAQLSKQLQVSSRDLGEAISKDDQTTERSRTANEILKEAVFTWHRSDTINENGLGRIQIGGISASAPISNQSPRDELADHTQTAQPTSIIVSTSEVDDQNDIQTSSAKLPVVTTAEDGDEGKEKRGQEERKEV